MWCDAAPAGLPRSRRTGYTLLEMVLVMVIVSVVMVIAIPAMRSPLRNQRLESVVQGLIGDLRLARTEAIRRNTTSFVGMSDATTYTIGYYPLGGGSPVVVYTSTLKESATFGTGTPDTLKFTPFGTTTAMTTYVLELDGLSRSVRVSAGGNAIGL